MVIPSLPKIEIATIRSYKSQNQVTKSTKDAFNGPFFLLLKSETLLLHFHFSCLLLRIILILFKCLF